MPMTQAQIDALMKQSSPEPAAPEAESAEKSQPERSEFRSIVYVGLTADAPLDADQLFPAASLDLSVSGMAFRWPHEVPQSQITIMLLIGQQKRGLRAEVTQSRSEGSGFVVECNFTGAV